MSSSERDVAASIRQRLTKLSAERSADFQQILSSYAIERLLYRLSVSAHSRDFVLKGATLFTLWEGFPHRQTRDVDLLSFGENAVEPLEEVFRQIIATEVIDDGLRFDAEVWGEPIRALQEYGGIRIHLRAHLGQARISVGVDVGFGDRITPAPLEVEYPSLLDLPRPRLRAYPAETVVAEKLQALVNLGLANSRMKDFFDLWHMAQSMAFDGPQLSAAVKATFRRRKTPVPQDAPLALSVTFAQNDTKQSQWRAFCRKALHPAHAADLTEVVKLLGEFLLPVLEAARTSGRKLGRWPGGRPWDRVN